MAAEDSHPSAMPDVIVTRALTRRFGNHIAVNNLTLDVRHGEIFGFLGHNGAGKTTTVRLLNGLLDRHGGEVTVLGYDPSINGPALRRQTGVLTETPSADDRLSAYENLSIYAAIYGIPRTAVRPRVEELLSIFGLADRAGERVGSYSKGMKQRLALARALLHRPALLFLDEPTSGLDPVAIRQFHDMIIRLSRSEGTTIFLCTHNLAEAQKLCDRVAVLQNGQLAAVGTPSQLAQQVVPEVHLAVTVDSEQVAAAQQVLDARGLDVVKASRESGELRIAGLARTEIPDIIAYLVGSGMRIYRADYEEPSLEEIYFALHVPQENES